VIAGTALRMKCYRTLGCLFTFELYIQENHTLVVVGPYAIIRHPSYTALIMTIIGACFSQANGSWATECGFFDTPFGLVLLLVWMAIAAAVVVSLVLRIPNEDDLLHARFGAEWETWALRVRYSLIPGVY
jgi:protein-S-isoprenylcysteine O-methyltransferase Ste14